jgi:hypothetical protein
MPTAVVMFDLTANRPDNVPAVKKWKPIIQMVANETDGRKQAAAQ